MRAAIYARVSSTAQRDKHTIASQLTVLPRFVAERGWELVGTYLDDGKTAKAGHLDKRDGFTSLLRDMQARMFDVVVVIDQDRLTRSEDLRERGEVLGAFQRAGVRIGIASTGQVLDLGSSMGDLLSGLSAFFAAEENRKRRERTKRGKIEAIGAGRKPAGPTPFGYLYDRATATWSEDHELAPIVREIYQRVAAGESCETISIDLEGRSIMSARPSRAGNRKPGRWLRERVWKIATVRTYLGEWTADKAKRLVVPVPPLVTEELWQSAQDSLLRYGKRGLRRTKHVYLCEGIAVCELCGEKIGCCSVSQRAGGPRRFYYVCRARRRALPGKQHCMLPLRRAETVDEHLWAELIKELSDPRLEQAVLRRSKEAAAEQHDWAGDADAAEKRIERLKRTEGTVLDRFRRDLVSQDALDAELQKIASERRMMVRQLETARARAASVGRDKSQALTLLGHLGQLRDALRVATPEGRRAVVETMFSGVGENRVNIGASQVIAVAYLREEPADRCYAQLAGSSSKRESNEENPVKIRVVL